MMVGERLRPLLLSLVSPVLLWGGYPGGGELWLLLPVALVPFLFSLTRMSSRGAVVAGLAVGTLHYLLQLYWIVIVLGRYGGLPVFVTVPALLLLAGYMAVYIAGFAPLARFLLLHCSPLVALLAIPALWVGSDWLRGWLFTGFPWMDIGYALGYVPQFIQLADLFGHGAVSYMLVLLNTLVTLVLIFHHRPKTLVPAVLATALLISSAALYSGYRWQAVTAEMAGNATQRMVVGIVQGNIDQSVKWSPANQQHTVTTYLDYSRMLFADQKPEMVVWPETALPFYPQTYPDVGTLEELVGRFNTALLTGAPWFEVIDRAKKDIRYYNSAQLLEPDGRFSASYYKSHLVPFGEYVPLRRMLPFLAPLVEAVGDFTPGHVEQPLSWHDGRIGVLICFESIFPDLGRKWSQSGANLLVNLTNDAWYGKSSAPYHSMAMTVFRAVETRRSVVRSANTGISGFVDPLGQLHNPSPLFATWSAARPVALMDGQTCFVRWGYLFPLFCLIAGLLTVMAARAGPKGSTNG